METKVETNDEDIKVETKRYKKLKTPRRGCTERKSIGTKFEKN